ncbi:diguanylate cyclase [Marinobacteraceae bacterium S3BR75-40.1]
MRIQLAEYDILQTLKSGQRGHYCLAQHRTTAQRVLLKLTESQGPLKRLEALKYEARLLEQLQPPAFPRLLAWLEDGDWHGLVLDCGDAVPLAFEDTLEKDMGWRLQMAVGMTQALVEVHEKGWIHRGLTPECFWFAPDRQGVFLLDLDTVSPVSRQAATVSNFGLILNDPHYAAPEQSGRMAYDVDRRSDLYSLGAILFYLFAGRPPFLQSDALELLHAHLALDPEPLVAFDEGIPRVVSDIVLKLLCKAPEDRYQSTEGLLADLRRALVDYRAGAQALSFPLDEWDRDRTFRVPERLFGREKQQHQLMAGFKTASEGQATVALVSGESGIGKSALIDSLQQPLIERKAYFVSGKFEQLRRDRPYSALVQAVRMLVMELLTLPEEQLSSWRSAITATLGDNSSLLAELVPELEQVVAPPALSTPIDSNLRSRVTRRALIDLFSCFCTPQRPLVLYLDDLQWADRGTWELLRELLQDYRFQHFYLLGAYREEEIVPADGLNDLLNAIQETATPLWRILLSPLSDKDVAAFLSAALNQQVPVDDDLTLQLLQKTGGVPFFLHQFLKSLNEQGYIKWNPRQKGWALALEGVAMLPPTGRRIAWLVERLRLLPESAQDLLQWAAIIGNQFPVHWIGWISGLTLAQVMENLAPAIEDGVIVFTAGSLPGAPRRTSAEDMDGYFAHDRIQQAAYELVPEEQRNQRHHLLGQTLLARLGEKGRDKALFDIVNHLNQPGPPSTIAMDLSRAQLNLNAGIKAKEAGAHASALHYFREGLNCLNANAWKEHYQLALELHLNATEAAFLSAQYDQMESYGARVIKHARQMLDAKAVHHIRIQAYNVRNQFGKAIAMGRQFLRQLGVRFPRKPTLLHIFAAILWTRSVIGSRSIEDLGKMPKMRDRRDLAVMETLHQLASSAYLHNPKLHPLLVLKMVRIAARSGYCPENTVTFATYGIILCGVLNQFDRGLRFGELSLRLVEEPDARALRCRARVLVNVFIMHWTRYAGESIEALHQAYQEGMESGDHEYAMYASVMECYHTAFIGRPVGTVRSLLATYEPVIHQLSSGTARTLYRVMDIVYRRLAEGGQLPWRLEDEDWDETTLVTDCGDDRTGLVALRIHQLIQRYRFGRLEEALRLLEMTDGMVDAVRALLLSAEYHFYAALIRIQVYRKSHGERRRRQLKWIRQHRRKLKLWSAHAPINYLHRHELVEAEWCWSQGLYGDALLHYEKAITAAREHGFIQDQAQIELCVAQFCLDRGLDRLASIYTHDALEHIDHWGARGWRRYMERLFLPKLAQRGVPARNYWEQAGGTQPDLDLSAFRKALRGIASARVHSTLVEQLISSAVTMAGAQLGHLFLVGSNGSLTVEAQWYARRQSPKLFQSIPIERAEGFCHAVVNYVARTRKTLVIEDARKPHNALPALYRDEEVVEREVRSLLCMPLISGEEENRLVGILYLENNAASGAFTRSRTEVLDIICLAAVGRIELSRKAVSDGLTGLFNHEYFKRMLEKEIQLSHRQHRSLSLILLDVDHFKSFNDQWGHQLGDRVLQTVAQTVPHSCRESDIVARYGGEEFAVILPDTSMEEGLEVAERIRSSIAETVVEHQGQPLSVTISLGVSSLGVETESAEALIKAADEALYQAKENGRNAVVGAFDVTDTSGQTSVR